MGIIINCTLIAGATAALLLGAGYFNREKTSGITRWVILLLGIFVCLWCGGYGAMGFCENFDHANSLKMIGLIGVDGYLVTEVFFIGHLINMPEKFYRIYRGVFVILGIVDIAVFGRKGGSEFIRLEDRTAYYYNDVTGRDYHYLFIMLVAFTLSFLAIIWYHQAEYGRQRRLILTIVATNLGIILGTIPDTLFPIMNIPSIPMSAVGALISFVWLRYASLNYNAFSITVRNLSDYVYNSVNSAVLVFDAGNKLSLVNKFGQKNLDIDGASGQKIEEIFDVTEEEVEKTIESLMEGYEIQKKWKRRGNGISCLVNPSIVKDETGDPYCIICMVYDMTKEEEMMNAIVEANKAKSSFLANMSHEIRTPINAVLGLDEMIIRESKDENITAYAKDIESAGKTLLSLVNDILDLSKIESGKMEILKGEYHLSSLLNDCFNMVHMMAHEKNLKLIIENDEDIPGVLYGDEIRIRQIITNLLSNAVKYTPKGQITMKVKWQALPNDYLLLGVAVTDTGIGIRKENMEDLFNSFKRVEEKKIRSIEGTGLGLPITKLLVELMGGSITVESEYGKGSTFKVAIPQKIIDHAPLGDLSVQYQNVDVHSKYQESFHAPDAKILVVDDVQMNLTVFEGLLKRTQIQVDTAMSGMESLAKIEKNKYDIIFMDHMMPEMDGIDTLYKINELKNNPNKDTPIIMLTANAILGMKEEYIDMGFTDYLSKPIQSKQLEEMIVKHLPKELCHVSSDAHKHIQRAKEAKNVENTNYYDKELDRFSFLDVDTGLMYCMNDVDFYKEMIKSYAAENKVNGIIERYKNEDWENYRIVVHALKSTSLNIGACGLSEQAKRLEEAAKEEDIIYIKAHTDEVVEEYKELLEKIDNAFA